MPARRRRGGTQPRRRSGWPGRPDRHKPARARIAASPRTPRRTGRPRAQYRRRHLTRGAARPRRAGRATPSRPGGRPSPPRQGRTVQRPGSRRRLPVAPHRYPGASAGAKDPVYSATARGVVPQIPRKLVTTSNDAGSHGRACISPTLISQSGSGAEPPRPAGPKRRYHSSKRRGGEPARSRARTRKPRRAAGLRYRHRAGGAQRHTPGSCPAR